MFKKFFALLSALVLLVLLPWTVPVLADQNAVTVVFTIGSTTYTVNGTPHTMDAAPFINPSTSRTYVPVRFLAEALGASVNWDPGTQMVTLVDSGITEQMTIGSLTLNVNGQPQGMDTAPQIVPPGRTELPARFVAQAFGYQVQWNAAQQQVIITNVTQPVGQIGTVLFPPALKNMTVTVGSTTATVTNLDGSTSTISLPAAPVYVGYGLDQPTFGTGEETAEQYMITHYKNYSTSDMVESPVPIHSGSIYVPVAAIFEAFGVPPANVQWDGSRLTIYLSPSEPIYLTPGSMVDTSPNGSTGNLQDPLLVINGVPMLDSNTIYGFMFGIDKAHDHLLNGIQDSQGGADMYNGTVLFNYYPMPS